MVRLKNELIIVGKIKNFNYILVKACGENVEMKEYTVRNNLIE